MFAASSALGARGWKIAVRSFARRRLPRNTVGLNSCSALRNSLPIYRCSSSTANNKSDSSATAASPPPLEQAPAQKNPLKETSVAEAPVEEDPVEDEADPVEDEHDSGPDPSLSLEERYKRYRKAYYSGRKYSDAWNNVWDSGETPFILGRPHPVLKGALERKNMTFKDIIVPGFGSGHDLLTLAECNPDSEVTALEIAGRAIMEAEKVVAKAYKPKARPESKIFLTWGDFFDDSRWETYFEFDPKREFQDHQDPGLTNKEGSEGEKTADGESASEGENASDEEVKTDEGSAKEATDESSETMEATEESTSSPPPSGPSTSSEQSAALNKVVEQEPAISGDDLNLPPMPNSKMQDIVSSVTGQIKKEDEEGKDEQKQDEGPVGFSLVYDNGFFSSLPTRLRTKYAERVVEMATPVTGRLLTIMYPIDEIGCKDPLDGPPFHATIEDYKELLVPMGMEMEGEPYESPDSLPERRGKEFICWWRRIEAVTKPPPPPKRKKKDWGDSDSDSDSET